MRSLSGRITKKFYQIVVDGEKPAVERIVEIGCTGARASESCGFRELFITTKVEIVEHSEEYEDKTRTISVESADLCEESRVNKIRESFQDKLLEALKVCATDRR